MSDFVRIHKQIVDTEKMLSTKSHKGISFVRRIGNNTDYINIQNVPEQDFIYFHNPSKLTAEQRKKTLEHKIVTEKILHPEKSVVSIVEEFEP
jgi:hypothetical protein